MLVLTNSRLPSAFLTNQAQPEPKVVTAHFVKAALKSANDPKVALIALDCSLAAWGEMRNHFPLHNNDIFDILVHLDRLRRKVEKVFPDARAFIRPGFDKIDLNS